MEIYTTKNPSCTGNFLLSGRIPSNKENMHWKKPTKSQFRHVSVIQWFCYAATRWVYLRARGLLYNVWKLAACISLYFPVCCPPVFCKSFHLTTKLRFFLICKNIYSACIKTKQKKNPVIWKVRIEKIQFMSHCLDLKYRTYTNLSKLNPHKMFLYSFKI